MSDDAAAPPPDSAPAPEIAPPPAPESTPATPEAAPPVSEPTELATEVPPPALEPVAASAPVVEDVIEHSPPAPASPTPPPAQSSSVPAPSHSHTLTTDEKIRGRARQKANIEAALDKIIAFARTKPHVTNDMIEKLLHVSDATANRYLNMLVVRAKLRREGKGRGVKYRVV